LRTTVVEISATWPPIPVIHVPLFAPSDRDVDQCRADGTSSLEIGPAFFQPSRKSHVLG
jgi:hypothetical protein